MSCTDIYMYLLGYCTTSQDSYKHISTINAIKLLDFICWDGTDTSISIKQIKQIRIFKHGHFRPHFRHVTLPMTLSHMSTQGMRACNNNNMRNLKLKDVGRVTDVMLLHALIPCVAAYNIILPLFLYFLALSSLRPSTV